MINMPPRGPQSKGAMVRYLNSSTQSQVSTGEPSDSDMESAQSPNAAADQSINPTPRAGKKKHAKTTIDHQDSSEEIGEEDYEEEEGEEGEEDDVAEYRGLMASSVLKKSTPKHPATQKAKKTSTAMTASKEKSVDLSEESEDNDTYLNDTYLPAEDDIPDTVYMASFDGPSEKANHLENGFQTRDPVTFDSEELIDVLPLNLRDYLLKKIDIALNADSPESPLQFISAWACKDDAIRPIRYEYQPNRDDGTWNMYEFSGFFFLKGL
jgi:hypothetical protein